MKPTIWKRHLKISDIGGNIEIFFKNGEIVAGRRGGRRALNQN